MCGIMRSCFVLAFLLAAAVSFSQQPTPTPTPAGTPTTPAAIQPLVGTRSTAYVRPDAKTRSRRYVDSVLGPFVLAGQVAGAGISTWRNSPEEWGDNWDGFGRRVASNFGRNAVKQTTIYGLDEAFKLDSNYYRGKNKSVSTRVKNALISPLTARDRNGKRVVGIPRLVGTYGSSIVAYETWYTARYDWTDGVKNGTISLGFTAAFNLFKEFVRK